MPIMVNLILDSINKRWNALLLLFHFSISVANIETACSLLSTALCQCG